MSNHLNNIPVNLYFSQTVNIQIQAQSHLIFVPTVHFYNLYSNTHLLCSAVIYVLVIGRTGQYTQLEFGMYPQSMPTEWTHARTLRPWQSVCLDL